MDDQTPTATALLLAALLGEGRAPPGTRPTGEVACQRIRLTAKKFASTTRHRCSSRSGLLGCFLHSQQHPRHGNQAMRIYI
jgi:hypothetical protein